MHISEWTSSEYWTEEQQFKRAAERAIVDRVQWVSSEEVGGEDGVAWSGTVHTYETASGRKVYAWGDSSREPRQIIAVRNAGAVDSARSAVGEWLSSKP